MALVWWKGRKVVETKPVNRGGVQGNERRGRQQERRVKAFNSEIRRFSAGRRIVIGRRQSKISRAWW